jgi:hypothetical protein
MFLGFKDGRNSRVLPTACCVIRDEDRAPERDSDEEDIAEELATGARLTMGAEPDPPPELLLEK